MVFHKFYSYEFKDFTKQWNFKIQNHKSYYPQANEIAGKSCGHMTKLHNYCS